MKLRFTQHAVIRISQRGIKEEEIIETVSNPEYTLEQDDGCFRYYKFIPRFGNYLRVICRGDLVVTVMPDRAAVRRKP